MFSAKNYVILNINFLWANTHAGGAVRLWLRRTTGDIIVMLTAKK